MKYSLAKYTQTISNTSVGNIDLTTDEIITLISSTVAGISVPVSGTTSGTLALDCDLGARIHVEEIRYYFDTLDDPSIVTPTIQFYFKNESFETYTSLTSYYNDVDSYYYATVSGTNAPRYVRVVHTIASGTAGSINGLEVINDETYVDFGADGTDTEQNAYLTIENNVVEIQELKVYNSGPTRAAVRLILEPQDTVADDMLYISDSADGPWYGVYREEDMIAGPELWSSGSFDSTYEESNILKLEVGESTGTYTTRIFSLDEFQRLTYNVVKNENVIVEATVEFEDHFSSGITKWDTLAGSADGNSYYLRHTADSTTSRTKKYYNYTNAWQLTFRFIQYGTGSSNDQVYVRPVYSDVGGTDLQIRMRTYASGDNQFQFYIAGTIRHTNTKYNWYNETGNWLQVKIQREFTNVRYKVWLSFESEPETWDWEGGIFYDDIATYAKFEFYTLYTNSTGTGLDDIVLIKNYSFGGNESFSRIATEATDTLENIEVRSSNSRPMDRETYIWLTGVADSTEYTNHGWIEDGTLAEQSPDWGYWGTTTSYWECWYDSIREDEYWVDKPVHTPTSGSYTRIFFKIRRKDGTVFSTTICNVYYFATTVYYNTYKLAFDQTGGFWIYYFLEVTDYESQNIAAAYHLSYYNASASLLYHRSTSETQGTFLYDMDSIYNSSGDLWYTDRGLSTVFKIDKSGNILTSFIATEDIRGVMALDDGGCWFIQQQALIRLNSVGEVVDEITLPTDTVSYVYSDKEDGFWLHDGYLVRHLTSTGVEDFNVEIANLQWITVIYSGVITKQHDGSTGVSPQASYISRYHKRVMRTWDYPQNEGGYKGTWDYSRFGVRSQPHDDLVDDHASNFPIVIDDQWNDFTEWKTVSLRDYNFTSEQYHQLRLTLRADISINSPKIYGIYSQRAIEIPNVYPNNYGTFYLKTDASSLSAEDAGNYSSDIRAFWFIDTE